MRWPATAGWPGALALAALALAAALALQVTPGLQAEAGALRSAPRPLPRPAPPAAAAPVAPTVGDVNPRVADLMEQAVRSGVMQERTQQRIETGAVPQLQLTQSARGGYAELRGYMSAALQADPGLALQRLRWRRNDAAGAVLEAEFQWALLLPPAGAAQ